MIKLWLKKHWLDHLDVLVVFKIFEVATITLFVEKNTKIQRLPTNHLFELATRLNFTIFSTPKERETHIFPLIFSLFLLFFLFFWGFAVYFPCWIPC